MGIATTSPTEKLEVNGNIKISGTGNGIKFADGTSQTTAATGGVVSGDGHSLDAKDGDPADALFVDDSGNVGIGTTNPGYQMEIRRVGGGDFFSLLGSSLMEEILGLFLAAMVLMAQL